MKNIFKKLGVLMFFATSAVSVHATENYPTNSISMLVGFAPGGPTDQAARIIADAMSHDLNQTVIVENKPGANSTLSIKALKSAKSDGYTILLASNGVLTVAEARYNKLPFDVQKDLMPIGLVAGYSHVLVVPADSKYLDVQSIIKNADKDLPSISSVGNVDELTIALFRKLTGKTLNVIPYRGQSAVIGDLVSDRVNMAFLAPNVAKPLVESGKLKAIAVSGLNRVSAMPDVPTMQEAGVDGFNVEIWNALVVNAGTNEDVRNKLSATLRRSLSQESVKNRLADSGFVAYAGMPEDLTKKIEVEGAMWKKLVKDENLPVLEF